MPVSAARAAAFDILLRVESTDAYASELLHSAAAAKLSSQDHRLATELVMGVLRWRSALDAEIARFSSQKIAKLDAEVLIALRIAAYQLLYLERIPGHAAVYESVELVRRARKGSAAAFVNALLRKLAEEMHNRTPALGKLTCDASTAEEMAEKLAHPRWLVRRWIEEYGPRPAAEICRYDQAAPETASRGATPAVEAELRGEGVELKAGQLLASARRVASGEITASKAFREGRITIQDEGSQLVALLAGKGTHILDCCAAPGGKTRLLAERNPGAEIVAVEIHPHRARLLQRLLNASEALRSKPSTDGIHVVCADLQTLPVAQKFDLVLADVPCSGTGTLARNPEIKWRLTAQDLAELQTRQVEILSAAMRHVAPGGRLVYSTCSLEREENRDVVASVLQSAGSFRLLDCEPELHRLGAEGELSWNDIGSLVVDGCLRTIPGVHPCDGFFAAILKRE